MSTADGSAMRIAVSVECDGAPIGRVEPREPCFRSMTHRIASYVATIALALSLAGCRDNTAPAAGDISVSSSQAGLMIVNGTGNPIHSVEMENGVLALIDLMPCDRRCEVQLPGVRRIVPWESVIGYGSGRSDYIVYWFAVEQNPEGSYRSGPVHITRPNP